MVFTREQIAKCHGEVSLHCHRREIKVARVGDSLRSLPFKSISPLRRKERKERQENSTCILWLRVLRVLRVLAVKILGFGGFFLKRLF